MMARAILLCTVTLLAYVVTGCQSETPADKQETAKAEAKLKKMIAREEREQVTWKESVARWKSLPKETVKEALSSLRPDTDNLTGMTRFNAKQDRENDFSTHVAAYIVISDESPPMLRVRVFYTGDDWLFLRSCTFIFEKHNLGGIITEDVQRSSIGGKMSEWADVVASDENIKTIEAVVNSKEPVAVYRGRTRMEDRAVSRSEQAALRDVLAAYQALTAAMERNR